MKKAAKIIVNTLAWIVLIFAFIITLIVFTADKNNGVSSLLGYIPLTVESDSMKPTFKKDDLIITHEIDDLKELKKDDVITFWTIIDGRRVKNTHRIVEIKNNEGSLSFITRGDNNGSNDDISVYPNDIIGKWTGAKISGFGKVMDFLRTKKGFFICILIPMALFFLFELYKLIATIIEVKGPKLTAEDEEEIKRRAVEEYLKEQQNNENKTNENVEDSQQSDETDESLTENNNDNTEEISENVVDEKKEEAAQNVSE